MRWGLMICLLGIFHTSFGEKEFRIFEAQGRAIEAKVVHVDLSRGTVELELRNNQRKKVKASIFTKEDQAYLLDWHRVREFRSSRLKVEPVKNVVDKQKEMLGSQSAIRRDTDIIRYDINLANRTGATLGKVWIEYNIFYEQEELKPGRNETSRRYVSGKIELEPLAPGEKRTVHTDVYKIYNQRLAGGYDYYTGGAPTNQSGKSKGIWIKLYLETESGLKAVLDICEPKTTGSQFTWQGLD